MIAGKLGGLIVLVLGGLLTNFASAGSDNEEESLLPMIPDGTKKYLSDACIEGQQTQGTYENVIRDLIDKGILEPYYGEVTCDLILLDSIQTGLGELATEMKEIGDMSCEELKASQTPEQLQALKDLGHKKAIECLN